jgi:hypothetical protein
LTDAALMNDGLYNVLGLAQRDYFQAFQVGADADVTGAREYWGRIGMRDYANSGGSSAGRGRTTADTTSMGSDARWKAKADGYNETPRTGPRTRPRSGIFNFYAYVGTYAA